MNEIDKLALMASLCEEHCELNHGPETSHLFTPAIDYLIQPFGYTVSDVEEVSVRDMIVPICAECAKALQGNEWTLFYCFECNSSHWISRKHARLHYKHSVLWLRGCPECTKEFGGLYFSDFKGLPEEIYFLSQQAVKKSFNFHKNKNSCHLHDMSFFNLLFYFYYLKIAFRRVITKLNPPEMSAKTVGLSLYHL